MMATVVMRMGRRRTRPACTIASRRLSPDSSDHFAKSMSRMAFFATMPMSRITPIRLIRFSVEPVTSKASITPMSESTTLELM